VSHWILIEAEHPENYEHVVCGPFETEVEAVEHMNDSLQVQGWCEDDAVDCWTVGTDAMKDAHTQRWEDASENWGLYRPIPDEDQTFLNP
jgi:hypothetical protein